MRHTLQALIVLAASIALFAGERIVSATNPPNKAAAAAAANAAKQTDAAVKNAKSSEGQAGSLQQAVAAANDAVKAAQAAVDDATKALKKIEDDTIDAQSADSEVGKSRDAFRAAEKKYKDARQSVLDDESFKDRLAKAKEADDAGVTLLALHKEFDEMPVIADSRTAKLAAKDVYDPLKTKLLEGTPDWVTANDDLKAKKQALDEANHQYNEATVAAAKAKAAARKAEAAAAAAAAKQQAAQNQNQNKKKRY